MIKSIYLILYDKKHINMMEAVITADIINSREVSPEVWLHSLKDTLQSIGEEYVVWEVFRGDSIQLIINPQKALEIAVLLKSIIKQIPVLDIRIGIGIGEITYKSDKVTTSNGAAFVHSGEAFDGLKKNTLIVKSPWQDFDRVINFVESWPKNIPLAIEFRHTNWYNDKNIAEALYQLLEENNISNIIVDTAGRRDLMHMRLTNATAFVRYVGANHASDYSRLDDWVERLKLWTAQGIKEIDFFIHQNIEKESPLLSAYFIKKINTELGYNLKIPNNDSQDQATLF